MRENGSLQQSRYVWPLQPWFGLPRLVSVLCVPRMLFGAYSRNCCILRPNRLILQACEAIMRLSGARATARARPAIRPQAKQSFIRRGKATVGRSAVPRGFSVRYIFGPRLIRGRGWVQSMPPTGWPSQAAPRPLCPPAKARRGIEMCARKNKIRIAKTPMAVSITRLEALEAKGLEATWPARPE